MSTLWLVGMMGSGKSTVSPLVAEALGRVAVDADALVEEMAGATVAELFARGESEFRRAEAAAIRSVAGSSVVVACGGGVVVDDDLVADMRRSGLVVWIHAPVEVIAGRKPVGRPLLADDPAALDRISREREPRYRAAAHVIVDGDAAPEIVAEQVIEAWSTSS